ncbi:MAG: hypothetical protein KTR20_02865, partial [Cellvibrionaceae bacterium]|nr:hypothetical protein [Cellvibrionaceae bacterium]
NDRIAWLSLLRTPWCGLDMHDLHTLANHNKTDKAWPLLLNNILTSADIADLSTDGKQRLQGFANNIEQIYQQQQRANLQQWIMSAWLALGGPASLLDQNELGSAQQFFNLLAQHDRGGRIQEWQTFDHAINTLFSQESCSEQACKHPLVDILTIHKAKGLEFDTVIIPGIDRNLPSDQLQLIEWIEQLKQDTVELLISPIHATGNERDAIYHYIRQANRNKQAYESDRVYYVGCTRAIKSLHLLAYAQQEPTITQAIDVELKPGHSFLHKIWPQLKTSACLYPLADQNKTADENPPADTNKLSPHPNKILRLASGWKTLDYKPNDLLKNYRLHNHHEHLNNQDNLATTDALLQRHGRYLGLVLHQAIQQITDTGYLSWSAQRIDQQRPFWRIQLRQLGAPAHQLNTLCTKIVQSLTHMLQSKTGCWLLNNKHEASACELDLWSNHQTGWSQSVIDRTFIDSTDNGRTRWIIDYKSSEPSAEQPQALFFQQEVSHYRQQLLRYRRLFEAENIPIRTALYFPLLGQLQEINPD